ncbi:MAG: hypothetical protein MJA29_11865, partial [Candidatus Omnitrophica bacterium]|nr:hypothetical protein [Candidatus Omnitrophota bacterium]
GGDYYIDDYEILYADINTGLPVISSVALIPIKDRRKPKDKQHRKIPELMIGAAHNIGHALGFSDQSYAYRSRLQESETHEETFFTGPLSVSVFDSLGGYVWEWGKVPLIDYGQDRPRAEAGCSRLRPIVRFHEDKVLLSYSYTL